MNFNSAVALMKLGNKLRRTDKDESRHVFLVGVKRETGDPYYLFIDENGEQHSFVLDDIESELWELVNE